MTTETVDGEGKVGASATPAAFSLLDVVTAGLPHAAPRTLLGSVTDVLHVDRPTVVHGSLASGVVISPWCRLDVHGRVDGPVSLGSGAVLRVRGEFCGDVPGDDGLVVVSGQVSLASARSGRVVLERGSLLVGSHGEGWWIEDDGSLVRTDSARHVEVAPDRRELVVLDVETDRFVPALVPQVAAAELA